ncbi:MAG: metallophosphoesterase, partial [Thermoguttaceae bacterium]
DYVDRGPDSRGVIERLLALQRRCRLIPLLGNHDEMLLRVHDGQREIYIEWLMYGGNATLESYDTIEPETIPAEHVAFLRSCRLYYETAEHFFVHGSYRPETPLADQPRKTLLWDSIKRGAPGPHASGKIAILGHSSQKSGNVLDLGHLKCIDTWCYGDGWLTALDVQSGKIWQADKSGVLRETPL